MKGTVKIMGTIDEDQRFVTARGRVSHVSVLSEKKQVLPHRVYFATPGG